MPRQGVWSLIPTTAKAQHLPQDTIEPQAPLTSLDDRRLAVDRSSNILVVGGSDQTDTVLRDAGLPVSRCAGPEVMADAFAQAAHLPAIVIAPLLSPSFDILDVIHALALLGFGGQLLAVTVALPDVAAVLRELRAETAGFRLDILQVGG